MNLSLDPIRPYLPLVYGVGALLILSVVFVGGCRHGQKGLAEAKAKHAATLDGIAKATAEQAARAGAVAESVKAANKAAHETYRKGVEDAYSRGVATAADIVAGRQPVASVWRDHCPQAAAGQGAGPAAGTAAVSEGRAEAIGRVLGLGGEVDATDALLRARLEQAQLLLDACYDTPASRSH